LLPAATFSPDLRSSLFPLSGTAGVGTGARLDLIELLRLTSSIKTVALLVKVERGADEKAMNEINMAAGGRPWTMMTALLLKKPTADTLEELKSSGFMLVPAMKDAGKPAAEEKKKDGAKRSDSTDSKEKKKSDAKKKDDAKKSDGTKRDDTKTKSAGDKKKDDKKKLAGDAKKKDDKKKDDAKKKADAEKKKKAASKPKADE
jgi:type IV secretory pathway VirB10-like protein